MRIRLSAAIAAIAFVVGPAAAYSAGNPTLTTQQKQTIEKGLSSQQTESTPSTFTAEIGAKVPQSVMLRSLPANVTNQVKSLKGDDFAKLKNNEIIIANPADRQIVALVSEAASTGTLRSGSTTGSSHMSKMK